MTTLILWAMHFVPGLRLRCDAETEVLGVDDAEMGEFAYDYVGIEAELGHRGGAPQFSDDIPADGSGAGGGREPYHLARAASRASAAGSSSPNEKERRVDVQEHQRV
jgi:Amt family ammonium transporter